MLINNMKKIELTVFEYKCLCGAATAACSVVEAMCEIMPDIARIGEKYLSLSLYLINLNINRGENGNHYFAISEQYFDVSVDAINLALAHLSRKKFKKQINNLINIRNKIKRGG